jgi:hypothetical protein
MNDDIKTIINEQFKTLPQVIQDTILNSNWQEKIRRVVKVNDLHIDQGAAIENLVLITMLGIETPEEFVQNAKEYANVTEEQAYNISAEVEREIFGDIRKKLIEVTDATGTIAEIDQATNQLDKVAAAIEKEASSKPSLKEKIPSNYFTEDAPKESVPQPIEIPTITTPPIAPPVVEKPKIDPKPIFKPMPKEIETQNTQPQIKTDPYREPIE